MRLAGPVMLASRPDAFRESLSPQPCTPTCRGADGLGMMNTTQTPATAPATAPVAVSAATPAEQDMHIAAIAHRNRTLFDNLVEAMRGQSALA